MDTTEAGQAAIAALNDQDFMGFRMVVKAAEDKPRSPRPSFDGGSGNRPPSSFSDSSASRDEDFGKGALNSGSNSTSKSGDKSGPNKFPTSNNVKKRKSSKKGMSGPDKYADGGKGNQHEKRPKSNRNQWLDDLDDF